MIFAVAFALGFVGYLPVGNINLTVVQLSVNATPRQKHFFIAFASFMEFVYCFFCLTGLEILLKQPDLVVFLNWSSVALFLLLGVLSFFQKETAGENKFNGLKRGILIAIFNPLQIPFWLVWGVYAFQNGLTPGIIPILIFSIACTAGTVMILSVYAFAGKKIIEKLKINSILLNRFIGCLLILLALLQAVKLLS